jgi:peptide-methionine (S)-S-oxide reductase
MIHPLLNRSILLAVLLVFGLSFQVQAKNRILIPAPQSDATLADASGKETAIFAGGCFWGRNLFLNESRE